MSETGSSNSPLRPPRLRVGDAVGIVSPSWGGASVFPHRFDAGVECLKSRGFRVEVGRHALESNGFVSATPENRVSDIHDMFLNPDVKAIVAAVGGDHSCHLLPLLDFDLIRDNPTILVGYSDITVLNVAIWKMAGLVTFNGPALVTDFAEYPKPFSYTMDSFFRAVEYAQPLGVVEESESWTEEFLDWRKQLDRTRPRTMEASRGWTWLRRGDGEGPLVGGCIESLQHLRGTPFWPDLAGAILFLETSEEAPSPARVDGILMDYENMGVMEHLKGLLFGRPMGYSDAAKEELRRVIEDRTSKFSFPVVTDMDFGHTAPQFTLPLGCRARIRGHDEVFEVLDPAVS